MQADNSRCRGRAAACPAPNKTVWLTIGLCVSMLWFGSPAWGAIDPRELLILVNRDVDTSAKVARIYQKLRGIARANVLSLSLGGNRQITPEDYWARAAPAIRKHLEANPEIRCILTTSGVPYTIQATDGKDQGAAFDSELAAVLKEQPGDRKRHQPNPLFLRGMNSYGVTDPRKLQMVYVARLDGPDLKTVTRMVEDAIASESAGLEGPVFGDARGLDFVTGYGVGDASIRAVIDRLSGAGFPSTLDLKPESWKKPVEGIGTQAAGAAFYVGWYDLLNFQDVFGPGLARGSIAWHIASQEAQDIWNPNGKGWCGNLIRRGAAMTLGPVREPYVAAFPHGDIFIESLLTGATVAESYWLALPHVSWAMVILGDPLYRPFASRPKPSLVARAYVADNPSHVLQQGKPAPLLVQVECVGPAGSGTPVLAAVAVPEMGLAAASGTVGIPALKAGESAIVRVPSVTVGDNPAGMFRLRLKIRTDGENSRQIVLEGKTGFSRLTGGLLPKFQMFVAPSGDALISGQPGRSVLIETATLRSHSIAPSTGFGLVGADFAPDGVHMAMAFLDPQQKKRGVLITDLRSGRSRPLPSGTNFLRWLASNEILLLAPNRLIAHRIDGGKDRTFDYPKPWSGDMAFGTVIPGTDNRIWGTKDGRLAVQWGSEPIREILSCTKVVKFAAVANDLSLAGGLDDRKRMWVQHGLDRTPEVVANGVERILWGPISRRAVVVEAGNKGRVYDGRDGSWIDLGVISGAEWSIDEERLLFIEAGSGGEEGYLSVLIDRRIERLCSIRSVGQVAKVVVSADGEKAFLLAGVERGFDVWMMALPGHTSAKKDGF